MKKTKAVCAAFALAALAAFPAPFEDGDTVVFLGDSITHGGRYHEFVTDFYRTRYPDRRIRFVNSGIGGDSASGAVKRLPEDVAEYDPTWVVVHFGMNDVDRGSYSGESSTGLLERRAAAFEKYRRNLDALVEKVAAAAPRAKFIYMTPTTYDDTAAPTNIPPGATGWATVNQRGCSVGLSLLAGHVIAKAKRDGAECVDLYSPLQNYLMKRRAGEPHFMLTAWDRVHPGSLGHSIMAWTFLKAQGVSRVVSEVAVDAAAGRVAKCENAELSGLAASPDGVGFTLLEKSLPFPVDRGAEVALGEFRVAETLNRETLSVSGLSDGVYIVKIDGAEVGEWTAAELAAGVNLAFNAATPQYAQAREVFDADARNFGRESVHRNHHSARWFYYGKADVDDVDAFAKWIEENGEKGYFAGFVPGYVKYWPRRAEARANLLAEQNKVYALAKPRPHKYEIALKGDR